MECPYHGDLVLVKIFLILLGPPCGGTAMVAIQCIAAEFAHDQGLVVLWDPIHRIHILGAAGILANVFVVAEHIQIARDRIINMNDRAIPRRLFSRLKSGRHQARGVGGVRILNELPQEAIPGIADGGLVANGVDDKSSAILVLRQEAPIPLWPARVFVPRRMREFTSLTGPAFLYQP
jgi:hypothetical protein